MYFDNLDSYLEEPVQNEEDNSIIKTVLQWTIVPVFDGFVQTILFGIGNKIARKIISKIRPKP